MLEVVGNGVVVTVSVVPNPPQAEPAAMISMCFAAPLNLLLIAT